MDDLDRLYFELVEILRRERPAALREPLSVREMYQTVIPYQRIRDPAGLRSYDHYEASLSRLLAGEREYVLADGEMQDQLRAGLEEPLPDIQRYLAHGQTQVRLNPEKIPPPGDTRYAPPEVREDAERDSEVPAPVAVADDGEGLEVELSGLPHDAAPEPAEPEAPVEASVEVEVHETPPGLESGTPEPAPSKGDDGGCPRCRGEIPEDAVFCPHCGARLRPFSCRACGAELQADWLYCARCGERTRGSPESA